MLIAAFIIESIFAQGYVGVGLINGPLWSVCAQWFFYWLFPLLTDRIHRKRTGGEIALWSLLSQLLMWSDAAVMKVIIIIIAIITIAIVIIAIKTVEILVECRARIIVAEIIVAECRTMIIKECIAGAV